MSGNKPKATKTHLGRVQSLKKLLQDQLDSGVSSKFESPNTPLKDGELRNLQYHTLIENVRLTDEELKEIRRKLHDVNLEEQRVLRELGRKS